MKNLFQTAITFFIVCCHFLLAWITINTAYWLSMHHKGKCFKWIPHWFHPFIKFFLFSFFRLLIRSLKKICSFINHCMMFITMGIYTIGFIMIFLFIFSKGNIFQICSCSLIICHFCYLLFFLIYLYLYNNYFFIKYYSYNCFTN